MRIWIDLGNSPHVPFFKALAGEFENDGHEILWTARDYAQTVQLARKAGLQPEVFGRHGGKSLWQKGFKFSGRVFSLIKWARGREIDLLVSHNSHEPLLVAKFLDIESVNLMDYEHHPANRLSFRLADRLIVPESFPDETLREFDALDKTVKFKGIKEDIYLADFTPDEHFFRILEKLGIFPEDILIVVRPHAPEALYHRQFSNQILDKMLGEFSAHPGVKIILLPRKSYQGEELHGKHPQKNIIIPENVLDGANLLAAADLVVSGGGTMSREAAVLGIPTVNIFAGKRAAVDEYLAGENLLQMIETVEDLKKVKLVKKSSPRAGRKNLNAKREVAELILKR